jgi:hypothetical protein
MLAHPYWSRAGAFLSVVALIVACAVLSYFARTEPVSAAEGTRPPCVATK